MDQLTSLFHNVTIDSLDFRNKISLYDGAYRRGDDIIILTNSVRTVRGILKYTFFDGNPHSFHNFSLSDVEEDDHGKSYFMLDGNTPYSLSLLEASYLSKFMEPEFMPSLFYSYHRDDFFILNVDGTEKYLFHIPFLIQYIHNFDDFDYVIHYIPQDIDGWCEPISLHQAHVISRIFSMQISELSPYLR